MKKIVQVESKFLMKALKQADNASKTALEASQRAERVEGRMFLLEGEVKQLRLNQNVEKIKRIKTNLGLPV